MRDGVGRGYERLGYTGFSLNRSSFLTFRESSNALARLAMQGV